MLNLICFAACIEGLFFFGSFAYVYFLRSKGLLNGLASGTNWVFRDESGHMNFAFAVIEQVREEQPELFDEDLAERVTAMIREAVDCETMFSEDVLSQGVAGMSVAETRQYLEYVADQRLTTLHLPKVFGSKNPFNFMELQDVQELTNFFERTTSSYQVGVEGEVTFDDDFRWPRPPSLRFAPSSLRSFLRFGRPLAAFASGSLPTPSGASYGSEPRLIRVTIQIAACQDMRDPDGPREGAFGVLRPRSARSGGPARRRDRCRPGRSGRRCTAATRPGRDRGRSRR